MTLRLPSFDDGGAGGSGSGGGGGGVLEALEGELARFDEQLEHDAALDLLERSVALKQRAASLHHDCSGLALAWVLANGPLCCGGGGGGEGGGSGGARWEAKRARKVSCRDAMATAEALLTAAGGDLAGLVCHLSAQPYKHGACGRTLGGEAFGRLFAVTYDEHLKLVRVDERFVRVSGKGSGEEVDHG